MAFRAFIVVGILFLIHSCAQVGTLTGGITDEIAPIPIESKMVPQNGSTNFRTSEIKIPFSEYIKLENPSETMVMVPPHAKPIAKIHGKTVFISWTDTLKDNTTYSLYLNGTIKDITEGNDSLMQIVFSTGAFIDSISYQVKVIDAFTNEPIKNCLVGLYEGETDSIRPTYFVKTTDKGIAKFTYLKEGKYTILAFDDKNKDMLLQVDERLAFRSEKLSLEPALLDSNFLLLDTIPLRLFTPKPKDNLRSFIYKPPEMFLVGSTASLKNSQFKVNNELLKQENYEFIKEDSLLFLYNLGDSSNLEFIAFSEFFTDTISLRLTKKEKEGKLTYSTNLNGEFIYPIDTLTLSFTDIIFSIDTSLIQLVNKQDSTLIPFKKILIKQNKISFLFDRKELKMADLLLLPNSVKTVSSSLKDSLKLKIQFKIDQDFGSIKLDASDYSQPIIVQLLSGGKVIRTIPLHDKKVVFIEQLLPNDYTFQVIVDENKNGKWDTGDRISNTFPENIYSFSTITKVRSNWEIDVKLTPNP